MVNLAVRWHSGDYDGLHLREPSDIAMVLRRMINGEVAWIEGPGGRFRIWALSDDTTDTEATEWIVYESEGDDSEWDGGTIDTLDEFARRLWLLARWGPNSKEVSD